MCEEIKAGLNHSEFCHLKKTTVVLVYFLLAFLKLGFGLGGFFLMHSYSFPRHAIYPYDIYHYGIGPLREVAGSSEPCFYGLPKIPRRVSSQLQRAGKLWAWSQEAGAQASATTPHWGSEDKSLHTPLATKVRHCTPTLAPSSIK